MPPHWKGQRYPVAARGRGRPAKKNFTEYR
ncbi:MAG: hypothetical protein E3J72_17110 [Planctomycetota bacterium]|nr:MAG: hypothetical protein E3J72_17110 [Planctomycetota bacterium]